MDLHDLIEASPNILPGHKKELYTCLKSFPDGIEKWIYSSHVNEESLYQGDILIDIPVCFVGDDGSTYSGCDPVAMISNSCDMQSGRNETVVASRIISLLDYEKNLQETGAIDIPQQLRNIQLNKVFSYFYLPPANGFQEGFIDFSAMVTIRSDYINRKYTEKRILSLSQNGFYLLLIKLTFHFARMECVNN